MVIPSSLVSRSCLKSYRPNRSKEHLINFDECYYIYQCYIYTNVIYTSIDISMLLVHIPNLLGAACGSDRHGVRGMMR